MKQFTMQFEGAVISHKGCKVGQGGPALKSHMGNKSLSQMGQEGVSSS